MFGGAFFGKSYFGGTFFGPATDIVVTEDTLTTSGYYGVDGLILKRSKEDNDIIALIMAMYETNIF